MFEIALGTVVGAVLGGLGVLLAWRRGRSRTAEAAVDALHAGVLVFDPEGRLVLTNPAARDLGMVRPGNGGTDQAHALIRTLAGQARRGGVPRATELDLPRARGAGGGRREPSGLNVRAVSLGGGYVAVEAADVTEAHRLARVRRDFVANVSHELKTPVGALRLLAEALIEATAPTGDGGPVEPEPDLVAVRRFAERILHESTRLGRLVGDLLELTRLQGADPLPEPEPVQVDTVIAEVIDRTKTPAAAKEIDVVVEGERGLVAYGTESQLLTALANLVENAIAYSPERTTVRLATRGDGEAVEIDVADQGIGIEAKDLDRVFERFYRADKARSRVTGGTGLGLAIVKHIATNHGGRVDVVSTVGEGSTFTLRLPARSQEATPPTPGTAGMGPAGQGGWPAVGEEPA